MPGLFVTGKKIQGGRGGIVAHGGRITTSAGTTSEVGVLRLDGIPVIFGRAYRIWTTPLILDSTVDGDQIAAHIRYTTNNTPASTGNAILPGGNSQFRQAANATTEDTPGISTIYVPGTVGQILSLLLTVHRLSGGGTVTMNGDATNLIELVVEDIGADPGSTGIAI